MQERLKELPKKFLEYWNKWTSKQKTIIISAVAVVIVMIAIFVMVLGRTKYVELGTLEDTKTASQIVTLLRESSIETKLGSDNLTVLVDEKQYTEAVMTVSVSDMVKSEKFSIADMFDTDLTTTNGERLQRAHLLNESEMETYIKNYYEGVEDVTISYIAKDTSNSILTSSKSIPVAVALVTNDYFDEEQAYAIATQVAAGVGNFNTDDVKVTNQKGKVLFNGALEEEEDEIDLTDRMALEELVRSNYIDAVTGLFMKNFYTEVEVSPHLDINFDNTKEMITEYFPLDGEIHGVLIEEHETASEGENGVGDIPGTDSNDETDYFLLDTTGGAYESSTMDRYYESSFSIKEIVYDTGTVDPKNSSIAISAFRSVFLTEEELEMRGLLDDMTFEEYKSYNSAPVRTEVGEDLYSLVSKGTGIPEENIEIITYDVYNYIAREEVARDWTFYLQILLAVILIAFLLFVVFRGMAPVEVTELEPELSVEQLLATTKENQSLEDVEFSEQSETRRMIEKFFEENPEAVAQLLRNWLNEDWD